MASLAEFFAKMPKKKGITTYHGSPHSYPAERLVKMPDGTEQFIVGTHKSLPDVPEGAEVIKDYPHGRVRNDKMGTGEGVQAYGWGNYSTEAESIGKGYRDRLSSNVAMEKDGAPTPWGTYWNEVHDAAKAQGIHPDQAYQIAKDLTDLTHDRGLPVEKIVREYDPPQGFEKPWNAALEASRPYKKAKTPGKMYEYRINADPEDFIDYYKPLDEQSPQVQAALQKYYGMFYESKVQDGWTGKTVADLTANKGEGAKELAEKGVAGIKFLANDGSRAAGEGAHNFVTFDDRLIDVVRKYGIAGASAMLGYNILDGMSSAQAAELQKQAYPTDSKDANTKSLANFLQDRGVAATQGASTMFDGETGRDKSIPDQLADIGTQAVAGINRGVASLPGLPKDLAGLADWGLDAAGVSDNETLRNLINPGRMWPISGEDSIKAWESVAGDLPEAETDIGAMTDFLGQLATPGPGELTTAALALPAAKKVIRLEDVAKELGVAPVDLANNYTSLRYGARRAPGDTAPEEWSKTVLEQPHSPMQKRKLEDYLGKTITMTPADTATIDHVAGVNGKDLASTVSPGGGPRYNLANDAAWAGAPGVVTKDINRMKKLEEAGHDPFVAAALMRTDAVDYNSSVSDIILQRMQEGGLTSDEMTKLNDFLVSGLHAKLGEDFRPELFPGIGSEKAIEDTRNYLLDNSAGPHGKVRAMMPKVLDSRGGRVLGAPEIGPIRFAVTDDEFAMQPAQHVGTSLFQIDPNGLAMPSDHGTYAAKHPKKKGSTSGRLESLIPGGRLFKTWATKKGATLNAQNQMKSGDLKSFNMSGVHEKITEQLLDELYKDGFIK